MQMIASKEVTTAIRKEIWPFFRDAGFTKISGRNAWRIGRDTSEVINFKSFNAYHATTLSCTTMSFAVNLGVFYESIARARGMPVLAQPPEHHCQARFHLAKTLKQAEYPSKAIWYVNDDGSNLPEVIGNAAEVLRDVALPWFSRFRDPTQMLQEYLIPRSVERTAYVCSFGSLGAAEEGSVLAIALGEISIAIRLWEAVVAQPYYSTMPDVLDRAHAEIRSLQAKNP